jgi:hypothetical protein
MVDKHPLGICLYSKGRNTREISSDYRTITVVIGGRQVPGRQKPVKKPALVFTDFCFAYRPRLDRPPNAIHPIVNKPQQDGSGTLGPARELAILSVSITRPRNMRLPVWLSRRANKNG